MAAQAESAPGFVLAAAHVLPVESEPMTPGWVAVEGSRIAATGAGPPPRDRGVVADFGRAAVVPGLVNAHTHLGCGFLRGTADDRTFFEWLTGDIGPRVVAAVRDEEDVIRHAALAGAQELLRGGVTCVADSFLHDAGWDAMRSAGLRGRFYREHFGSASEDLPAYVADVRASVAADLARATRDTDVGFGLAPHSPYTCPRDVLNVLREEADRHRLHLTIHVDESAEEHAFFSGRRGPMYELFARDGRAARYDLGTTPVEALDALGLLGPRTLAVHAVQVTSDDIGRLARTGTPVVHCPGSNLKLAVGVAPVLEMLEAGVNVALGTDSAASTGKLDMFEEMRLAVLAQRGLRRRAALSAPRVLEMATLGGARALGLEADVGSLLPGKLADITVVSLEQPRHRPVNDPCSAVVWGATPDDVCAVFVGGRRRWERR